MEGTEMEGKSHSRHQPVAEAMFTKLTELTRGIRVAMLTSHATGGPLHSRPMARTGNKFDRTLWFFADQSSDKCHEVTEEQEVSVSYSDPHRHRYVALAGRAQVVRDRQKAAELWTPLARIWFPKGVDDPNLVLIRVNLEQIEYWEALWLAPTSLFRLFKMLIRRRTSLAELLRHDKLSFVDPVSQQQTTEKIEALGSNPEEPTAPAASELPVTATPVSVAEVVIPRQRPPEKLSARASHSARKRARR